MKEKLRQIRSFKETFTILVKLIYNLIDIETCNIKVTVISKSSLLKLSTIPNIKSSKQIAQIFGMPKRSKEILETISRRIGAKISRNLLK